MSERIRVLGWPAFRSRHLNPYTSLLYSAMSDIDVEVRDSSASRILRGKYDILHVHWPEHIFDAPRITFGIVRSVLFLGLLVWTRVTGKALVWTIHNIDSHDGWHPLLQRIMTKLLARRLDGYIAMSRTSQQMARERLPILAQRPGYVIPHGHYRGVYPDTMSRLEARESLGIGVSECVFAFVGSVGQYKNVQALIRAFCDSRHPHARLIIAGKVQSDSYWDEIRQIAGDDARIIWRRGFVPDDELQRYFNAADLTVYPYRNVLNSGSALMSISFLCPVLVPRLGSMEEMSDMVGGGLIQTYTGELTSRTLSEAMERALRLDRRDARATESLNWQAIAEQTRAAYLKILARARS